jgi:hypothetical protein
VLRQSGRGSAGQGEAGAVERRSREQFRQAGRGRGRVVRETSNGERRVGRQPDLLVRDCNNVLFLCMKICRNNDSFMP